MKTPRNVSGLWVAALTPMKPDLSCDTARLAAHCRFLFDRGCDGVAIFGTTGEGPSFSVAERLSAMEALLKAGIPARRMVLGTGAPALADAAAMNRAATQAGLAGALMLPPFYFKNPDGEGVYRAFAQAIERAAEPRLKLYLYNIPSVSAVGLDYETIGRLARDFPGVVAGVKDSSADWSYTKPLLERFSGLDILVGAEHHLPMAMAAGAAGTICAIPNVAPGLVRALLDAQGAAAQPYLKPTETLIGLLERHPFVPALRAVAAAQKRDDAWLNVRPPLHALSDADGRTLRARVAALSIEPAVPA
ncbi:MAG: dihydrodipicolinate synthase family protein [Rhodospirillales bacterium]